MKPGTRPLAINAFALLYLGQALISAAHSLFNPAGIPARIERSLGLGQGSGELALDGILAVRTGIVAWLVWLVYARASKLGKWAMIALFLGRVWQGISERTGIVNGLAHGNPNTLFWTVESVLYLAAGACLFLPQSEYWFATKGRSVRAEAQTFE